MARPDQGRLRWEFFVLAFAGIVCTVRSATAQNFERYGPLRVQPTPELPRIPQQALNNADGSDEELVDRLDAVIFLDDADKVDAENTFEDEVGVIRRFSAKDSIVHSRAMENIVQRYIGKPITLRRLNEMSRELILLYRRSGQPVVDVIIPEQRITGGTVQIVIVESRIGRVIIDGDSLVRRNRLAQKVQRTRPGDRLLESNLRHDLFRLNDYPFRRVEPELRPGTEDGTTDVIYKVHEVCPVRGYAGYDDTGVRNLGLERLYTGFTIGDPWGLDSLLSYQGTTDGDFRHLNAHSLFYQLPLDELWSFDTYASWAGIEPIVAVGLNQQGEAWQTGFALNRHLVRDPEEDTRLIFGFDFKRTNTNVEFGGVKVFDNAADLVTLRLGYQTNRRYEDGEYFRLLNDVYVGPGSQFSSGHTTAAFNTIRPGTSPDFVYNRLFMERVWNLPDCWQLLARGTGQVSSERLLFSETMGLGGFDSIRGYDQRTLNADAGWMASFEFGPRPQQVGTTSRPGQLRTYVFTDMGDAYTMYPQAGERAQEFLISTGVGLRYSVNDRYSLRLDYGYGLTRASSQPDDYQRIHIGFVMLFGPRP